jgi:hypothetical protein
MAIGLDKRDYRTTTLQDSEDGKQEENTKHLQQNQQPSTGYDHRKDANEQNRTQEQSLQHRTGKLTCMPQM